MENVSRPLLEKLGLEAAVNKEQGSYGGMHSRIWVSLPCSLLWDTQDLLYHLPAFHRSPLLLQGAPPPMQPATRIPLEVLLTAFRGNIPFTSPVPPPTLSFSKYVGPTFPPRSLPVLSHWKVLLAALEDDRVSETRGRSGVVHLATVTAAAVRRAAQAAAAAGPHKGAKKGAKQVGRGVIGGKGVIDGRVSRRRRAGGERSGGGQGEGIKKEECVSGV